MHNHNNNLCLRRTPLSCMIAMVLALGACQVHARDLFNPALLEQNTPGQAPVDLSDFQNEGGQAPGTYRVDIILNNAQMDTRNVDFRMVKDSDGKEVLRPCIPVDDLSLWGVLTSKYPQLGKPGDACANLQAIPQASSEFRFSRQQLLLSIPQSAVNNSARGWVDPHLWDDGIPAAILNYSASGSNNYAKDSDGYDSDNQYVNLRPGLNLGPWRLRNYTTWSRSHDNSPGSETTTNWDTVYTYLQRDIRPLRAQLTLGDSNTPSDIFDSIPFRGAQLASDDDMLPESLRGYAPVVRGIARTNAQVTVRQNGYIIYQTYVSPGSFEITDMYPTGGSGDLHVNIKESDGSEQNLVVPYASLPVLQREGRFKYGLTTGVYRSYDSAVDETPLTEATAIYGLPAGFTLYGGGQFSSHYQSLAFGVGKNLGTIGAISVDVTQAWSTLNDTDKESGQSWRMRYSKNVVETGTNFTIAGYRYATDGYWDMQEVLDTYRDDASYSLPEQRRNRAELTVSQSLWQGGGNLSLSAIREDYWGSERRMESYGVSYNNSWKGISYGLNYAWNHNSTVSASDGNHSERIYDNDQLFSLSISVPMSLLLPGSSTSMGYSLSTSKDGNTTNNVSLSGTALANSNLSWSVMEGYGSQGQGNSGSTYANWRASSAELNGGYSWDRYSQRLNYGIQGGIVLHENGVTLSQPLGETIGLVAAPGADDVNVLNNSGVSTDYRGYAVVPYISPYSRNTLTLNPETLPDDTEVNLTSQTVIPTRGAVVRANYQTSVGGRALMTLKHPDGNVIPFGAMVSTADNQSVIVGDQGQVYVTGLRAEGALQVRWGSETNQQCQVNYQLPQDARGILQMNGVCRQ